MSDRSSEEEAILFNTLSHEILAGIGYVATEFGYLEVVIEDAISEFLGAHSTMMYAITANVQMNARLKILRSLAHYRCLNHPGYMELIERINRIETELAPWRNTIIHGFWAQNKIESPLEARVLSSRANKRIQFRAEHVNRFYLGWLGTQIGTAATELSNLLIDMGIIKNRQNNPASQ
jgi:hypothetical protein